MENILMQRFRHAALIAPAGKAEKNDVNASAELLEKAGLKVTVMPHVISGSGESYLAAPLKERLQDLHACWRDKSIDLVFCVRGGFGAAHLLPKINWHLLRTRKIPFVGYSDITALHMAMLQEKVGTPIAAPMPLVFSKALFEDKNNQYTRDSMCRALTGEIPPGTEITMPDGKDFNTIKSGYALCRPVTANLSVLTSLCGTKWFPRLRHRALIIEDLNEPIYKIDRYLTQLQQSGAFKGCEALLFGQFNNCGEETEKQKLFERFAQYIKGPVIANFPFGHEFPSASINMRHHLRIEKDGKIYIINT